MKLQRTSMLGVPLVLVAGMLGFSAQPDTDQEAAITEIKKLGGTVTISNDGSFVEVKLRGKRVTDAGLKHLEGLTKRAIVDLDNTQVTDEGVEKFEDALENRSIDH